MLTNYWQLHVIMTHIIGEMIGEMKRITGEMGE